VYEVFEEIGILLAKSEISYILEQSMDIKIINQWIEGRSDIALKKLMSNEPLTFEDNIIFALIGQREEMRKVEQDMSNLEHDMTDIKISMRDIQVKLNEYDRRFDDIRKEMTNQTRWVVTAIVAVPVLLKLIDAVLGK
jgi:hypothetical protein